MEKIVHGAISIDKPRPVEVNVSKPAPNLVTEAFIIEKPRHVEVTVFKGSVGVNGRDGFNGKDGIDGANGEDGGVFVPKVVDGKISWDYQEEVNEYPSSVNLMANIDSITNSEIYNIVNGD